MFRKNVFFRLKTTLCINLIYKTLRLCTIGLRLLAFLQESQTIPFGRAPGHGLDTQCGHKLRVFLGRKTQFVTVGII
jgi:hypothetical protein